MAVDPILIDLDDMSSDHDKKHQPELLTWWFNERIINPRKLDEISVLSVES
jgi:hypothetical protein